MRTAKNNSTLSKQNRCPHCQGIEIGSVSGLKEANTKAVPGIKVKERSGY